MRIWVWVFSTKPGSAPHVFMPKVNEPDTVFVYIELSVASVRIRASHVDVS
jgi:hypothetical protein